MAVCHENSTSMFTSRPSPTSFNFPPFGYPAQAGSYAPEYGQYGNVSETYQQAPWAGMYAAGPRTGHNGIDEWSQNYMVPVTSSLQQPYNYSYRAPVTSAMGLDYSQGVMGHGHSPLTSSPPLTSSSGDDSPNGSDSSVAKALRAPYEWMTSNTLHAAPINGKTRTKDKYRNVYSDHQRLELEKEFHFSKFITMRRKAELSDKLNLSQRQVKIWFQNRRAKERKQNKKDVESGVPVTMEREESSSPPSSTGSYSSDQHLRLPHIPHAYHQLPQSEYPSSQSPNQELSPPSSMHQLPVKSELSSIDLENPYTRYMPYR